MKKSADRNCKDCGIRTTNPRYNYYMVTKDIWNKYGVGNGMLCLECLQKRIGRPFRREDFPLIPINFENPFTRLIIFPSDDDYALLKKSLEEYDRVYLAAKEQRRITNIDFSKLELNKSKITG